MKATCPPSDPVPQLMDELIDGLHLLYECRRRGVADLGRLLDYIEYTIDEIERYRLGTSGERFKTVLSAEEAGEVVAC